MMVSCTCTNSAFFVPPAMFRKSFRPTAPPFIDYLKDILRRYPDGGQILKVGTLLCQVLVIIITLYNISYSLIDM